jgi:ArsR family transcriptional regulator
VIEFEVAERCAKRLSAFSDPTRLGIIDRLRSETRSVTELARLLNEEIVNVSHHLSVMREAGVVKAVKQGRQVFYSLNTDFFCMETSKSMVVECEWCRLEILHS